MGDDVMVISQGLATIEVLIFIQISISPIYLDQRYSAITREPASLALSADNPISYYIIFPFMPSDESKPAYLLWAMVRQG